MCALLATVSSVLFVVLAYVVWAPKTYPENVCTNRFFDPSPAGPWGVASLGLGFLALAAHRALVLRRDLEPARHSKLNRVTLALLFVALVTYVVIAADIPPPRCVHS